jgi:hypothetical protein
MRDEGLIYPHRGALMKRCILSLGCHEFSLLIINYYDYYYIFVYVTFSWKVSSCTKGNTCEDSQKNIQIFERHVGIWYMVSHKKILYSENLYICRLGW